MGFEVGIIGLLILLAIGVAYVMTLIRQAKESQWGWFVFTLLFSPVFVIYWITRLFGGK